MKRFLAMMFAVLTLMMVALSPVVNASAEGVVIHAKSGQTVTDTSAAPADSSKETVVGKQVANPAQTAQPSQSAQPAHGNAAPADGSSDSGDDLVPAILCPGGYLIHKVYDYFS